VTDYFGWLLRGIAERRGEQGWTTSDKQWWRRLIVDKAAGDLTTASLVETGTAVTCMEEPSVERQPARREDNDVARRLPRIGEDSARVATLSELGFYTHDKWRLDTTAPDSQSRRDTR
jgi:hypothetical protein